MPTFSDPRTQKALRGRREFSRFHFLDGEVGIRILLEAEIDAAREEAQAYIRGRKVSVDLDPEFLDRVIMRAMLCRACVDVDDEKTAYFADLEEVGQLDAVLTQTLWQAYLDHQDSVNPLESLNPEAVDRLVEALGKGSSGEARLSGLDAPSLRSLVRSMARLLKTSPASKSGTSSTGSPPGGDG